MDAEADGGSVYVKQENEHDGHDIVKMEDASGDETDLDVAEDVDQRR